MCVGRVGVDREREREQVNRKRKLYTVSSLRETHRRTKTEARVETTMAADPASSSAELGPEDSSSPRLVLIDVFVCGGCRDSRSLKPSPAPQTVFSSSLSSTSRGRSVSDVLTFGVCSCITLLCPVPLSQRSVFLS